MSAMERVGEIRAKRERQFYKGRMAGNKERALEADRKLVEENQHLLPVELRDEAQKMVEDEKMDVEVDELEAEKAVADKSKLKQKRKQRLVRGQGVEEMDVDE